MKQSNLSAGTISEIIAMAWADDVSFDEIKHKTGFSEHDVIRLMRSELKSSSFKLWRARVSGRKTKHRKLLKRYAHPAPVEEEMFGHDAIVATR